MTVQVKVKQDINSNYDDTIDAALMENVVENTEGND